MFLHICDTYNCDYLQHTTLILFLINRFLVKYRFPFPILRFLPLNHVALPKDQFLKKMLLKRAKPVSFFHKTIGSNNSFTLIENNSRFLR